MNACIYSIEINDNVNKFITSTFGLGGKMPGSLNAQTRVKEYIKEFLNKSKFDIKDCTIDISSHIDQPFIGKIVVTGTHNDTRISSSIEVDLKDTLEKKTEFVQSVEHKKEEIDQPTATKAIVISTPEKQPVQKEVIVDQVPEQIEEDNIFNNTTSEEVIPVVEEKSNSQETTHISEIKEEKSREKIVNLSYSREILVSIGKFINSVNLFNIGNMMFGDTITIAQTNEISKQIFEIMGFSDDIREYVPDFVCDINSNMDYRNGTFSLDVRIYLNLSIQVIESDYIMSFTVIRK